MAYKYKPVKTHICGLIKFKFHDDTIKNECSGFFFTKSCIFFTHLKLDGSASANDFIFLIVCYKSFFSWWYSNLHEILKRMMYNT